MSDRPRVALFATCLVDLFRPSVGFAAARLLKQAGCDVEVPRTQTCCGQPAFNNGDRATARAMAADIIASFERFDYVVAPSGSCTGMLRVHLPELFRDEPKLLPRAEALAGRCHELISFLVDIRGMTNIDARIGGTLTYHDSCSGLRELGIKDQPRHLLRSAAESNIVEMKQPEVCCGFGGTFCVKYPEISTKMVDDKARDIEGTGADMVVAGDLGCLLNIAGRLHRKGSTVAVRHVAEVLAGDHETPPIGARRGGD